MSGVTGLQEPYFAFIHWSVCSFASCFDRGTKRLVSVNICSVEGNSADIFFSKVSPGIFYNKGKIVKTYYFRRDKTAVLGAIRAQLPFSENKYQLLNSWNRIPSSTIFCH